MPPKKKAAAATSSKTRSSGRVVPETITNKRGKEVETTAAAARPKRDAAPARPIVPSTATGRRTGQEAVPSLANTSKKRGRPAKVAEDDGAPPAKKRGRPPKKAAATPAATKTATKAKAKAATTKSEPPKKRGRPSAAASKMDEPAVPEAETAPPKRRGRPPKGGETTQIAADDEAVDEQLEEELQDAVEEPQQQETTSKRKKGKGKAPKTAEDEDANDEEPSANYWLMKAEQDGHDVKVKTGETINTTFTIDDLRSKTEPEAWDGVRNPTAAKNMRDMRKGDLAFFYASGGKQGRKPGIVGIMEVVGEHEPDETTADESSAGYVEKEKDRAKWCVVRVEFRKKLTEPVYLSELQKFAKPGAVLENMQEFKAARLSVSKVTKKEWDFIVNNLVEGYEDDEEGIEAAASIEEPVIEKTAGLPDSINGAAPPAIMTEPDVPPTDMPDASSATGNLDTNKLSSSRPASRAGSRAGSVTAGKGNSRPASRAGSLAPPGGRRGRSVTPKAAIVEETTVTATMQTIGEEDALPGLPAEVADAFGFA
ncbi:hypothetical protein PRZ48_001898 [Zasmidium cellare]|uniref:EVE domain-containing protein n=1 Tax=Zasmidium cellare TaxID=395010 RepID=A0ABR0F375_ZASCE|nr:hypothetical protein PRZ48_001898 [Zasmidium cellare]